MKRLGAALSPDGSSSSRGDCRNNDSSSGDISDSSSSSSISLTEVKHRTITNTVAATSSSSAKENINCNNKAVLSKHDNNNYSLENSDHLSSERKAVTFKNSLKTYANKTVVDTAISSSDDDDDDDLDKDDDTDIIRVVARQKAAKASVPPGITSPSQLVWYKHTTTTTSVTTQTKNPPPRWYPCLICSSTKDTAHDSNEYSSKVLVQAMEYPPSKPFDNSERILVHRSRLIPYHGTVDDDDNNMEHNDMRPTAARQKQQQQQKIQPTWSRSLWKAYVQQRQQQLPRPSSKPNNYSSTYDNNHETTVVVTPTDIQAGYFYLQRILDIANNYKNKNNYHHQGETDKAHKDDSDDDDDDDDDDMDVPYSLQFSDHEDGSTVPSLALSYASLFERRKEPLRPGDVIMYTHPIFVDGDKRGERRAVVLSTDPDRDPILILDNGDPLPDHILVTRIQTMQKNGQLLDHPGVFRPIDEFLLQKLDRPMYNNNGQVMDAADGIRRQAKRFKSILQQGKEELSLWKKNNSVLPPSPPPESSASLAASAATKTTNAPLIARTKNMPQQQQQQQVRKLTAVTTSTATTRPTDPSSKPFRLKNGTMTAPPAVMKSKSKRMFDRIISPSAKAHAPTKGKTHITATKRASTATSKQSLWQRPDDKITTPPSPPIPRKSSSKTTPMSSDTSALSYTNNPSNVTITQTIPRKKLGTTQVAPSTIGAIKNNTKTSNIGYMPPDLSLSDDSDSLDSPMKTATFPSARHFAEYGGQPKAQPLPQPLPRSTNVKKSNAATNDFGDSSDSDSLLERFETNMKTKTKTTTFSTSNSSDIIQRSKQQNIGRLFLVNKDDSASTTSSPPLSSSPLMVQKGAGERLPVAKKEFTQQQHSGPPSSRNPTRTKLSDYCRSIQGQQPPEVPLAPVHRRGETITSKTAAASSSVGFSLSKCNNVPQKSSSKLSATSTGGNFIASVKRPTIATHNGLKAVPTSDVGGKVDLSNTPTDSEEAREGDDAMVDYRKRAASGLNRNEVPPSMPQGRPHQRSTGRPIKSTNHRDNIAGKATYIDEDGLFNSDSTTMSNPFLGPTESNHKRQRLNNRIHSRSPQQQRHTDQRRPSSSTTSGQLQITEISPFCRRREE